MPSKAYQRYVLIAGNYEEPDYDVHIDDPVQNKVRLMTEEEFDKRCESDSKFKSRFGLKFP
jgi:hypothetical protein